MSERISILEAQTWVNMHNNVSQDVRRIYQVANDPATGWRDGLAGVQTMIGQARERNEQLRSFGGRWSLSKVAVCGDSMHDTTELLFHAHVGAGSIVGASLYPGDQAPLANRLFYFQAGAQISAINNLLEDANLSLPTTGASNGQTIAGAISTGTHGSAMKVGAMQDYVRALHIVSSETSHAIIQPASNPIVNTNLSDAFGAQLISDDEIFNAALVSFGSCGVILGVVVETVSLFLLETRCQRLDYTTVEALYPFLANFDHTSSKNLTGFLAKLGLPADTDPHHINFVLNPFSSSNNAFLQVMYKRGMGAVPASPIPTGFTRVGNDILSLMADVTTSAGVLVPPLVNTIFGKAVSIPDGYTQTPKNIFGDTFMLRPRNGGASIELGVAIGNAADVVRRVLRLAAQEDFVGVVGVRFVKNSAATLAFTRYAPLTCTIELPGLNTPDTQSCYTKIFAELDEATIPFTLHWGQQGDYSPQRLALAYGKDVQRWVDARKRLLPDPRQRIMFSNDFLKKCGLAESLPLTGGGAIG